MLSVKDRKALTAEVRAFARSHGAKMVGIASAEALKGCLPGHHPTDWLPGARSVVVCLIPIPRSSLKSPHFWPYQYADKLNHEQLEMLGHEVSIFLEEKGHDAISHFGGPFDITEPHPRYKRATGVAGWIALPQVAVAAGLGEIGRSRLLITKEYGLMGRLVGIITTAELMADEPLADPSVDLPLTGGKICKGEVECGKCANACASGALRMTRDQEWMDACIRNGATKESLGGFLRHVRKIMEAPTQDARLGLLFSPDTYRKYMHLFWNVDTWCNECIKACPIGAPEEKTA